MDFAIASIINLLSSGGICYLGHLLHKKSSQLSEYNDAKLYTPSSLLKELNQPNIPQNFKRNPDNPREFTSHVFIEGNVDSRNYMRSRLNGESKLVYSLVHRKEIFTNHLITHLRSSLIDLSASSKPEIQGPSSLTLRDPITRHSCHVRNSADVDAYGALEKIDERFRPNRPDIIENILSFFTSFVAQSSLTRRNLLSLSGLSIGWTEKEMGISLGSALTVYGRVVYDSGKGTLRIDTPLYFLKEKATIIRRLYQEITAICGGGVVLLVLFGLSASYLVKKVVEHRKEAKKRKIEQERELRVKKRFEKLEDDYRCIICVDNPRNVILEPCKHLSICAKCYNQLPKKLCPVCKVDVENTLRVSFCA